MGSSASSNDFRQKPVIIQFYTECDQKADFLIGRMAFGSVMAAIVTTLIFAPLVNVLFKAVLQPVCD